MTAHPVVIFYDWMNEANAEDDTLMSALRGEADITRTCRRSLIDPKRTSTITDVVVAAWDLFRFYIRSVNQLAPFVRFGD